MATIYLSSTYEDLTEHREAVYRALRRLGHDVRAMEDYVATDQRPVDKCLADVAEGAALKGYFSAPLTRTGRASRYRATTSAIR